MEPKVKEQPEVATVKVDLSNVTDIERENPHLAFLHHSVTTGDALQDYWAQMANAVKDTGEFDMKFLAIMEQTFSYLENHRGEPMLLLHSVIQDGKLVVVRATIGILGEDEDILARGYAKTGFKNAGDKIHHLEVHAQPEGNIRLYRAPGVESDIIPIAGDMFVYGMDREGQIPSGFKHEVVAGDDILPWIKENFGDGANGYEMFIGILHALAGTGKEVRYLSDETFLKMLSKERRLVKMVEHVISDYKESQDNYIVAMAGNTAQANIKLKDIDEHAGDLSYRLHSMRNGDGGVMATLDSETEWVPTPEARKRIIGWRLELLNPGDIDLEQYTD